MTPYIFHSNHSLCVDPTINLHKNCQYSINNIQPDYTISYWTAGKYSIAIHLTELLNWCLHHHRYNFISCYNNTKVYYCFLASNKHKHYVSINLMHAQRITRYIEKKVSLWFLGDQHSVISADFIKPSAWNTTAYYSYYFDYLLSLPFKDLVVL